MRETANENEDFGPGKQLPRGRHGLPRETVTESQRGRIILAMIEAVAQRGYPETRVADVVEGAGVARKTFYDFFDDKQDCFLAAYDQISAKQFEAASSAFSESPDARRAAADPGCYGVPAQAAIKPTQGSQVRHRRGTRGGPEGARSPRCRSASVR